MPAYRAVLFDFFGTLTHAVVRGPWHTEIALDLGCDPAAFRAALDRSFRRRASGQLGPPVDALRTICAELGVHPTPGQLAAAVRARLAAIRADTRLRPDAVPALTRLRNRGVATAVVSDCGPELPTFWPDLPVAPLVAACAFSVEVGRCKPHPAIYQAACASLGVAPADCLYVGDGGGSELTGAAALGLTAVRLAEADLREHLVFIPDYRFTGPSVPSLTAAVDLLDHAPTALRSGGGRMGG